MFVYVYLQLHVLQISPQVMEEVTLEVEFAPLASSSEFWVVTSLQSSDWSPAQRITLG